MGRCIYLRKGEVHTVPQLSYLMFTSPESFTLSVHNATKNWDGVLEFSTDTTNWAEWNGATTLSSVNNKLYLRGINNTKITGIYDYRWALTGSNISCDGNIENLLNYQTVLNGQHPTMSASCYESMFHSCTSLITAPELPATTLVNSCYNDMFYNCTSLTTIPELPATTLAELCYHGMFTNCTSLITVPKLPATKLVDNCYEHMFWGCSKIKLSATKTGTYNQEYRIPASGSGIDAYATLADMFTSTGGTFAGTPEINTTYYLDSSNHIV